MSNPTSGPWIYGQDGFNLGNGVVYARHANGNPKDICTVRGWGADQQANVKLIAAAPDLLEALQEAVRWHESIIGESYFPIDAAKKAIAKARGEA